MRPGTGYPLAGLTVLAGAGVLSGVRPLAILGGLPLVLLLPGAALSAVLFPVPRRLPAIERIMLVPVLSLGTIVLGGLLAFLVGAPLDRVTWLALTAGVTLAGLAAAGLRTAPTPAGQAVGSASGAADVRGRPESPDLAGRPAPADSTPGRPAVPERPAAFEPVPVDRRRRLLHRALPGALVVLMLAGAATLSLVSSIRTHRVTVTTLSVVPPGTADSSGERSVRVDATGLTGGVDAYRLVVTTAKGAGGTSVAVTADRHGLWTSTLRLPGDDRLTLALFRAGEATAVRTVIVAGAVTG